jgi:hypothetical protein
MIRARRIVAETLTVILGLMIAGVLFVIIVPWLHLRSQKLRKIEVRYRGASA